MSKCICEGTRSSWGEIPGEHSDFFNHFFRAFIVFFKTSKMVINPDVFIKRLLQIRVYVLKTISHRSCYYSFRTSEEPGSGKSFDN
jgi:hypothetical protein